MCVEQPCNNSDNPIKLVTSCEQLGPNLFQQRCEHNTRKNAQVVTSLPTSRQQDVFARLVTSCQQVWNNLLTTCNNLVY